MSVPVRLLAFALAAAATFGLGFGLGAIAGPFDDAPASEPHVVHEGPMEVGE